MIIPDCNTTIDEQNRELLVHGTAAFPMACYHDDLTFEDCCWHWHDELEFFLVTEGSVYARAGAEKYTIRKGEGLFVNTTILHEVASTGASLCRLHSLVFHPRLVGGSIDSIYWQNYLQPLMSNASLSGLFLSPEISWQSELLQIIEAVWHAYEKEDAGYEFLIREKLSRAVFLLNTHCPTPKLLPSEKTLRDDARIKQMLQYIHAHYHDPITILEIAESAMISESEALRCFRAMLNTTPIQYVKQYRLERAARLLSSTEEKIVTIGLKCGFQEMSYFARSFREMYGCTPSAYRTKKQELSE